MIKITLYTTDSYCNEACSVAAAHMCMFDNNNEMGFHFIYEKEQITFIQACIKLRVKIKVEGPVITLLLDGHQKVRVRIDALPEKIS